MTPWLRTEGLAGQRGERLLFQGLDLSLLPGEVVWLRGRNGQGKTTLLRILAGLSTPASGQWWLQDMPACEAGPAGRRRVLYIGHANALKDDLSAREALAFLVRLQGTEPAAAAVDAALARLGLTSRAEAPVRTLSQGQRRRVALARLAMASEPGLWLLDEPYDALDRDGMAVLDGLLGEHASRGGATLLTSHQAPSLRQPEPRVLDLEPLGAARQAA